MSRKHGRLGLQSSTSRMISIHGKGPDGWIVYVFSWVDMRVDFGHVCSFS